MSDIYQFIDDLDSDRQSMVAKRLEDCAQMPRFAEIRENYFDKIGLPSKGSIHELGCGTGAVCRAIASRPGFNGTVSGSDLSASLIDTANEIAAKTDLQNIHYYQSDGQRGDHHESRHDLVLAHTVISHVPEPKALLTEAIRLTRPGGRIIIHDGDFASMTFGTGAPELDRKMPDLILQSAVANRYIMRELPRLFQQFDVDVTHAFGDVLLEIGTSDYFPGLTNYCPVVVEAGIATQMDVDTWVHSINRAISENAFFGSCNFVTYCLLKKG